MIWKNGIETCIISYKKRIASLGSMQDTGCLGLVHWDEKIFIFNWSIIVLQYCIDFWHTSAWISHGFTCVPLREPPSHLLLHPIPLGYPSVPALSILYHASNLDWWFVSHMIIYMFQCHSSKSSHPCSLPQSPKDCSIHLCLFCCLAYRVIVAIFLNSIYMY